MSEAQVNQEKLFLLAQEVEAAKDLLKQKQKQLEEVLVSLGLNTYHQDPVNGVVYKVYKPDGTFINFKNIDYKRTALTGEKGGTVLSKAEAESMGFKVGK